MKRTRTNAQKFWTTEIEAAKKRESNWRERGQKIVDRYRDEKNHSDKRLNILWANTEILKPAVFSKIPTPDVRRTNTDENVLGRIAAEVMERTLSWFADQTQFARALRGARDDMLLPGRGLVRLRYDAKFIDRELIRSIVTGEEDGEEVIQETFFLGDIPQEPDFTDNDGNGFIQLKVDERVSLEYVFWKDVLFSDNSRWDKIWWIAFRHEMEKDKLVKEFGKAALDKAAPVDKKNSEIEVFEIWEIWNKRKRQRIWLGSQGSDIIEREDDPLGLTNFFPVPEPLFSIKTTDSFIPVPEFTIYQDQADELDDIENRLSKLVQAAKAVGVYDGVQETVISLIAGAEDGDLLPIKTAEQFRSSGGFQGSVFYNPIQHIAQSIAQLTNRKEQLKSEIFEITGISDILRGQSDPRETASAQRIKQSVGSIRLRPRREPMEEFIRDIYRMMTEIIADKFDGETISKITGFAIPPQVLAFISDPNQREFQIDIETESTVQPDADRNKEQAIAFIGALTTFLGNAGQIIQVAPQATPLMMELLKFGARQFKVGRRIEQEVDTFAQLMAQQQVSPQQREQQADRAAKIQQTQLRDSTEKFKTAAEMQMQRERSQADILKNLLDIAASGNR